MKSNDVVERITAAVHDYFMEHRVNPRRITVSQEVARELDAAISARNEKFDMPLTAALNPKLLVRGHPVSICGIPVVADLESKDIVDIRDSEVEPD